MTRRQLLERAWRMQAALTAALAAPSLHEAAKALQHRQNTDAIKAAMGCLGPAPTEISGAAIMAHWNRGDTAVLRLQMNLQRQVNAIISTEMEAIRMLPEKPFR